MYRIFYILLGQIFLISNTFAASGDAGVFEGSGVSGDRLRSGNLTFDDIPRMIQTVTSFLLGFSATISMIMLIVGALQYSLASVDQNKKKATDTIEWSIIGFVVSVSAWFIVRTIIANL